MAGLQGFIKKYGKVEKDSTVTSLIGEDKNIDITRDAVEEAVRKGMELGIKENDISPSSDLEQVVDIVTE